MAQNITGKPVKISRKQRGTEVSVPKVRPWFYALAWASVWVYYRLGGWKVHGKENIPRKGAVIIASNHVSFLDPPAVNFALPRVPRTMAKSELFEGKMGWIIRSLGGFPVHRGAPDRNAIRRALKVLEAGMALSIFPEGTRSRDGQLGEAGPGFAYIVHASKVPVVPVYLQGNEKSLSPQHPKFRLVNNQVWIGQALYFENEWQQKGRRDVLNIISERTMASIAELREQALKSAK